MNVNEKHYIDFHHYWKYAPKYISSSFIVFSYALILCFKIIWSFSFLQIHQDPCILVWIWISRWDGRSLVLENNSFKLTEHYTSIILMLMAGDLKCFLFAVLCTVYRYLPPPQTKQKQRLWEPWNGLGPTTKLWLLNISLL